MLSWLGPIVGLIATAVGTWLGSRILTPTDKQRADLLDTIALGAASFVVLMFPGKPWAELLELVVQRIAAAAGLPTKNATAIQNAAAAALNKLGVTVAPK